MRFKTYHLLLLIPFLLINCTSVKPKKSLKKATSISKLRFIDEYIIPANQEFENTNVGGLSSIDYANGKYYLICDDRKKPVRFYEMDLVFDATSFSKASITNVVLVSKQESGFDPESLRFDANSGTFIWTSEGVISKEIDPAIYQISQKGELIAQIPTPAMFKVGDSSNHGPRNNGTFEGLTLSQDPNYLWIGMELPLKQDGQEPKLEEMVYPLRISKIHRKTGEIASQFAYQLDKVSRDSKPSGKFRMNGLSEILLIDQSTFLFVERSYSSGHEDGGNSIRVYQVDASDATDISKIKSLKNTTYKAAKKTLLFDFDSIRPKLTKGMVDNIEGITFGKKLANGNQTLIFVSDNNFNFYGEQLSQLILFEVILSKKSK